MKLRTVSFLSAAWMVLGVSPSGFGQPNPVVFDGTFYSGRSDAPNRYDISEAGDGSILMDISNDTSSLFVEYHFLNVTQVYTNNKVALATDNTGDGIWANSADRVSTYFTSGNEWTNAITTYSGDCSNLISNGFVTSGNHSAVSGFDQDGKLWVKMYFRITPRSNLPVPFPRRILPHGNMLAGASAFNFQFPAAAQFCDPASWPELVLATVSGVGPVYYYAHQIFETGSEARGDGDGRPESGERLELAVKLINMGDQTAQATTATLQVLSSTHVTILDSSNYWEDIAGGEIKDNLGNFVFDIDPNLPFNRLVTFLLTVSAVGGEWTSRFSVLIYVQDQVQINAPTNLVALAQNSNLVQLTWQDNSNNEDGFKIERNTGGGWTEIATANANVTSYDDSSVTQPVSEAFEYQYRVSAFVGSNNSEHSNESTAYVLAQPGNLSASAISSSTIRLTWNDNIGSLAGNGFKIERKIGTSDDWSEMADVPAGSLGSEVSYADNGLAGGTTYTYRLRAYRNSASSVPHFSSYSNEASLVVNATELKPEVQAEQSAGAEFWVDVVVSNVQNLFGLGLELNFTNTDYVDVGTPASSSVVPGAFLGNDVVFVSNVYETIGKVNIGISRKAGQDGINGSGIIARVKFKSAVLTPSGTQVLFSFSNVSANEPSGNVINVQLASATVTFKLNGLIVWPGDANGDGTVNQADVLPIGLNWGKTHSASLLIAGNADGALGLSKVNAATLSMTIVGDTNPGQEFWIDVRVADVADLFGTAFELLYSPITFVEAQTAEAGGMLGNDVIFFPNLDNALGKVSIGLTRKSGQSGVDGSGMVARIKMKMASSATIGAKTDLILQNTAANDPAGQPIQLVVAGQSLVTEVTSGSETNVPTVFALHANVPNPFNPSTAIKYDIAAPSEVTVVIFDMLGKPVRTLVSERQPAGRYAATWDGRDEKGKAVSSGVFICQLRTDGFVQNRKMLLLQ